MSEQKNNLHIWIFLAFLLILALAVLAYVKHEERVKKEAQVQMIIAEAKRKKEEQIKFMENLKDIFKVNIYNTGGLKFGKTYIKIKNNSNYLIDNITYHIVFYGISGNIKEETKERFINLKPYEERIIQLKHVNYSSVKQECIRLKCNAVQVDWKK